MINYFTKQKRMTVMSYYELENLRKLARSWNNLDISFIQKELNDDFIFESQWVLSPIKGEVEFLSYLQSKFAAIKDSMRSPTMVVTAEIAFQPSLNNRPCIVLTQTTLEETRQVSILIEIQEKKIKRIDVCFIPDPREAELTGEIPK